jgi:2-polyprenyl-3-methyl-5-hydroxy-6-metoxy-1,4-benzoquinol methylase
LRKQPPANSFLKPAEIHKEHRYPLDIIFCSNCTLVQLSDESYIDRDDLFLHYSYASSIAGGLRTHFEKLANIIAKDIPVNGLVVDMGSNDGVLLKPLKDLGIQAVGIEPASNLAEKANALGLETIGDYLNDKSIKIIISKYGHAEVVTAANVFAHLEDVHDFIEKVKLLLNEHGVFIIEVQYFADMIKEMTFDNIYHEHVLYYSLQSISVLLRKHKMNIFRVEQISTHGGSLRVHASKDTRDIEDNVSEIKELEKDMKLDQLQTYLSFANQLKARIHEIRDLLLNLKDQNKFVIGYGAPAKSSTMINSIGLDNSLIQYIVEDSPLKQGLLTPGSHIPIVSPDKIHDKLPDYIVIFAWNYAPEIIKKLEKYKNKGVRFIIPMPTVTTI